MKLFNNTTTAGSGVSKDQSGKKPFFRFWELFSNKFGTFFKINLVYFLFCIPIVTFGPATAAMTAMMRNIYLGRPQFVFSDFFKLFKENFKKSFAIGIFDVIGIELAIFLIRFWQPFMGEVEGQEILRVALGIIEVLFLLFNFYIYPQIAALELPTGAILKNAVILMFVNIKGGLIALLLYVGYAALLLSYPLFVLPLLPFVPLAWLGFISFFCCYPAIQRVLINPYYERTGEKNPEVWETDEDAIFKDMGGSENPVTFENKKRGTKIIK